MKLEVDATKTYTNHTLIDSGFKRDWIKLGYDL
jgi:hypothetical protein